MQIGKIANFEKSKVEACLHVFREHATITHTGVSVPADLLSRPTMYLPERTTEAVRIVLERKVDRRTERASDQPSLHRELSSPVKLSLRKFEKVGWIVLPILQRCVQPFDLAFVNRA